MRVLHVLHHSVPYFDGYSVRSQAIVNHQTKLGLDPVVVTSPHHEIEVGRINGQPAPLEEQFGGTRYYRTALPAGTPARVRLKLPMLRERLIMSLLRESIERVLSQQRIDIIHAHSPVLCGLPAIAAARRHRLPLVYEVRAFWEDALLAPGRTLISSMKYRYSRGLETRLFQQADAVVAISRHMLEEIAGRGITRQRLHTMPNGVDLGAFNPMPPDRGLADQLGVDQRPVIGFIGSFFKFEGLDCLVRAMPAVLERIPNARLLLVGTGEATGEVGALIEELGLTDAVLQTGRVPHDEVMRYYSIMDVLVYPRHRDRITELVTPLKPLEAMAVGKAVIGSDVGGIRELLDDGRVGLLFRAGDAADLARQVTTLLLDQPHRERLIDRGRQYVTNERQWEWLVKGYLPIYESLRP